MDLGSPGTHFFSRQPAGGHGTPTLVEGDPIMNHAFTYRNRKGGQLTQAGGLTFWKRNGPTKKILCARKSLFILLYRLKE